MSRVPGLFAEGRGRRFALVAGLALGQAAAAALAAFATRDVFANWGGAELPEAAIATLIVAAGLLATSRWAERVVAERLGQEFAVAVRRAVFIQVARMPAPDVARRRTGALALRFVGDLSALRTWVSRGAARLVSAGVALPATIAALAWLNPAAALGAAVPLLCGLAVMALIGARLSPLHRRLRRRRARLAADMSERLPMAPELRLMGRLPRELARLDRLATTLATAALARTRSTAALRVVPDLAGGGAGVAAMLACWQSGASSADLAGSLAALALMIAQLRDLAGVWDRRRAYCAAWVKLTALLNAPRMPRNGKSARPTPSRPALVFKRVNAAPLRGVSEALDAEAKVAVVGANGTGKSTLLMLAAGLMVPESGKVLVFGSPPSSFSTESRREAILYIGARPPVLTGSLRRAIALGLVERPDDRTLQSVVERVGLSETLARLGGLDGTVREAGRNLSAGEVARLSLARLALSSARLVLLDEPDAALDALGRATLLELIAERPGAVLIATHDATLAEALGRRWTLVPPNADGAAPREDTDGVLATGAGGYDANAHPDA